MHTSKSEIKVRYGETDQMGVIYHANYIVWFELGRTDFFESLGFNYNEVEDAGYVSPVLDISAKYLKPVLYKNKPYVITKLLSYSGIRFTYGYEVYNELGELCVTGETSHTIVTKDNFKPTSLKRAFPKWDKVYKENIFES